MDVLVRDLDGDGLTDLAFAALGDDAAVLFPGRGAGAFGAPRALAVTGQPQTLTVADVDADGRLDLLVGCASLLSVCMAAATGRSPPPVAFLIPGQRRPGRG
ncbi:MAG: VCBS repeat-containing protein [Planctomycetes bacterium]|nr:VCBS repeat-containing protein [Planctomycetota bacterium]